MEKHLVLANLFRVSERLRLDRAKHKKALAQAEETAAHRAERTAIDALPNSGRNLLCLLSSAERANQRSLAKQMNISAQAVSETVKKLEQCGFVCKELGAQNNENLIALTETGHVVAQKLDRRIKVHAEEVLAHLSDEELETLNGLLSKIIKG